MSFKQFIRLTFWKIIVTLIVFFVLVFVFRSLPGVVLCKCPPYGTSGCVDYYNYLIYSGSSCHCFCVSLGEVLVNYLWFGLIPLIIIYLIVSGVSYTMEGLRKT